MFWPSADNSWFQSKTSFRRHSSPLACREGDLNWPWIWPGCVHWATASPGTDWNEPTENGSIAKTFFWLILLRYLLLVCLVGWFFCLLLIFILPGLGFRPKPFSGKLKWKYHLFLWLLFTWWCSADLSLQCTSPDCSGFPALSNLHSALS